MEMDLIDHRLILQTAGDMRFRRRMVPRFRRDGTLGPALIYVPCSTNKNKNVL